MHIKNPRSVKKLFPLWEVNEVRTVANSIRIEVEIDSRFSNVVRVCTFVWNGRSWNELWDAYHQTWVWPWTAVRLNRIAMLALLDSEREAARPKLAA